jgi:hypothetical protein
MSDPKIKWSDSITVETATESFSYFFIEQLLAVSINCSSFSEEKEISVQFNFFKPITS